MKVTETIVTIVSSSFEEFEGEGTAGVYPKSQIITNACSALRKQLEESVPERGYNSLIVAAKTRDE